MVDRVSVIPIKSTVGSPIKCILGILLLLLLLLMMMMRGAVCDAATIYPILQAARPTGFQSRRPRCSNASHVLQVPRRKMKWTRKKRCLLLCENQAGTLVAASCSFGFAAVVTAASAYNVKNGRASFFQNVGTGNTYVNMRRPQAIKMGSSKVVFLCRTTSYCRYVCACEEGMWNGMFHQDYCATSAQSITERLIPFRNYLYCVAVVHVPF